MTAPQVLQCHRQSNARQTKQINFVVNFVIVVVVGCMYVFMYVTHVIFTIVLLLLFVEFARSNGFIVSNAKNLTLFLPKITNQRYIY